MKDIPTTNELTMDLPQDPNCDLICDGFAPSPFLYTVNSGQDSGVHVIQGFDKTGAGANAKLELWRP